MRAKSKDSVRHRGHRVVHRIVRVGLILVRFLAPAVAAVGLAPRFVFDLVGLVAGFIFDVVRVPRVGVRGPRAHGLQNLRLLVLDVRLALLLREPLVVAPEPAQFAPRPTVRVAAIRVHILHFVHRLAHLVPVHKVGAAALELLQVPQRLVLHHELLLQRRYDVRARLQRSHDQAHVRLAPVLLLPLRELIPERVDHGVAVVLLEGDPVLLHDALPPLLLGLLRVALVRGDLERVGELVDPVLLRPRHLGVVG
mmetsp:Transcript_6317/g.28559  ORF Transcript_6317/g.28559 Transcript_6317/m.28559 type:complete len:253 (-) Transcript_6317:836-1594(-)